jgi:hypothetical protein
VDRRHFDSLARLIAAKGSRRSAIATLVAAAVLGSVPNEEAFGRDHKSRRRKRRRRRNRTCYPGARCVLGQNGNGERCDFSGSAAFQDADLRFANLAHANLSNINAMRADLRGADLRGACIVESILFEAQLGTAKLDGAIFCNTVMPDGTINTSGCEQATSCCPACVSGECPPQKTCAPLGNICTLTLWGDACCPNTYCAPPIPSKYFWLTWCQDKGCTTQAQCDERFPGLDVECEKGGEFTCPGIADTCCRNKRCANNGECPKSGVCCSVLDIGIARCCSPGQRCTAVGCL